MAVARALCPVLVGRDAQLGELEDALLGALRGEGGVLLLGGDAGLGKSRLANDLSGRAQRLGATVLCGACSEAELALPYLPFLEAIGNHLSRADLEGLRQRLGPAAAELAQLFPQLGQAPASAGDPTQAKLRLFEALVAILHDAALAGGLLLVVEDIHWADPATRELVDYLTRRLRAERVLVLATYRSDELHRRHPLTPTVQGWRRAAAVREVQLAPLDPGGVAGMVRAIFDEAEVSPEFRDFLHRRTEGNPFVLEEMLKAAIDRGDIFRGEDGWDRKAIGELRLPETVRDTILLRIERLGADEREVLSAAAVIGRSFEPADLVAVSGLDEETVLSALRTCVLQQLVEEHEDGYWFRHALTREAVYEDMLQPVRRRLHGRVAEVLQARTGARSVDIASHLLSAGRSDDGARMCELAAEEALRASAYGDAALLFERAADHAAGASRGSLLCRAGSARTLNQEPLPARRLLAEGVQLLEEAGLIAEAARARLDIGRTHWDMQQSDLARAEYLRALRELEPLGPSAALALAYLRLSGLETFEHNEVQGLAHAEHALRVAESAGAALEHAWALNFLAIAQVGVGQVSTGLASMERSYEEAIAGGFLFQAQNAVYNGVWICAHIADGAAMSRWIERNETESHVIGAGAAYLKAHVELYRGQVRSALESVRRAAQAAAAGQHGKMIWRCAVLEAHALAEADRGTEAADVLPAMATRVDVQDVTYDTLARVRTAQALGDHEAAARAGRTVEPVACTLVSPADAAAEGVADPVWVARLLGAVRLSDESSRSPRWLTARGRLALLERRYEDARALLTDAVSGYVDGGLRLDAWHAARALAEAEARLGNLEVARERLETVAREAAGAGAALAARLAVESAAALGLEVDAAPAAPAPSTPDAPVEVGERLVTVLFVDVRGYTAMTGRTAPADLADKIGALQRWSAEEVRRHRGVVDKFAGDAVMATFNVSGASVDHAEQALQAAIAIRDKAAALGLGVGAGIAVGPAIVGHLAHGGNMSVLGEVTNLAARLQASSGPGEITLSSEAYRRLAGRAAAAPVELDLKGFDRAVTAYRLPS